MTKKEIIKLLDKEIGLFKETEDENSLGELYLTNLEFLKVDELFEKIEKIKAEYQAGVEQLKGIIHSDERFEVWTNMNQGKFLDKTIHVDKNLLIIGNNQLLISGCIFTSQPIPKSVMKTHDQKEN